MLAANYFGSDGSAGGGEELNTHSEQMKPSNKKYYSYKITQRFLLAMDQVRQQGKVTANTFAEKVGMSASNINRLRSSAGENAVTLEAIGRMCELYKVSPYWLLTGKGDMFTNAAFHASSESLEARIKDIENASKAIESSLKTLRKKR